MLRSRWYPQVGKPSPGPQVGGMQRAAHRRARRWLDVDVRRLQVKRINQGVAAAWGGCRLPLRGEHGKLGEEAGAL